jgi:hypothetical protein
LTILLAGLVLLCLATGLVGLLDIQQRRATLAGISDRAGPLSTAAEEIYQSISDADATAAGAFLVVGGIETRELRDQYQNDIGTAARALSTAAAGAPTGESAKAVSELSVYLPMYAGLVEDARTLNRQGKPEGGAYLSEASALAQGTMLPSARKLFDAESARLASAQDDADRFPWFPLAIGVVTLAGLIAAQVWLAGRTNRIFNAGLLVATGSVLVGIVWFAVVSALAAGHNAEARDRGSAAVHAVALARIAALQARSDEALTLVARGGGTNYDKDFDARSEELGRHLLNDAMAAVDGSTSAKAVEDASGLWRAWLDRHAEIRKRDSLGDWAAAVRLATTEDRNTAVLSGNVNNSLGGAIEGATTRFNEEAKRARTAVSSADLAVATLLVLAALAVGFGFAPRLREFR